MYYVYIHYMQLHMAYTHTMRLTLPSYSRIIVIISVVIGIIMYDDDDDGLSNKMRAAETGCYRARSRTPPTKTINQPFNGTTNVAPKTPQCDMLCIFIYIYTYSIAYYALVEVTVVGTHVGSYKAYTHSEYTKRQGTDQRF